MGTVQGYVRDARNYLPLAEAAPLAGAAVQLVGTSRVVYTNASGFYQMTNVPAGARQFTASKSGYISLTQNGTVPAGGTLNLNFSLSPVMAAGQWRIVLTWGANPRDLDSHLWLPSTNRYHVYYPTGSRGSCTAFPWACLDRDDVDGYGPETITIAQNYAGNYRFALYNWSNERALAGSGARVQVYRGSTLVGDVGVPATGSGRWWYLMDFNASTGAITWVNQIQSTSPAPYAVPADKTVSKAK